MLTKPVLTGTRVRRMFGGKAQFGTVVGISPIDRTSDALWARVLWDDPIPVGIKDLFMVSELDPADAPWPMHYHRCEWCGVLSECTDSCGQGGKYDPYTFDGKVDRNADGSFPGGFCDQDCYDRKRPRGCQHDTTDEGKKVRLEAPPF